MKTSRRDFLKTSLAATATTAALTTGLTASAATNHSTRFNNPNYIIISYTAWIFTFWE